MIPGIESSLSGLQASQIQLEVSANNVANLGTSGFKASSAVQVSATALPIGQGTSVAAVTTNYSSGGLFKTNNPSDLAINGKGFFEVVAPNGETYFTRNGDFVTDGQGFLRTPEGAFLSAGGMAIKIPSGSNGYSVEASGLVSATFPDGTSSNVGQIDLATFNNENGLMNTGGNLFKPTAASGMPLYSPAGANGAGTLAQGYLEVSNVDSTTELVNQVVALQSFKANAKVLKTADEMTKTVIGLIS